MDSNIHHQAISEIIGKEVRIYTTGEFLTQDHKPERINIELSDTRRIVRVWRG